MPTQKPNRYKIALIISCVALLWLPNFILVFETNDMRTTGWGEGIAYGALFWGIWFSLFKKAWLALLISVVPSIWWFGSLYLRIKYQTPLNQTFLAMLFDTNPKEIVSFFFTYGWSILPLIIAMPIITVVSSFYLINHPVIWNHRSRYIVLISGFLIFLTMYILIDVLKPEGETDIDKAQGQDPFLAETPRLWLDRLGSVYPLDFIIATLKVYQNNRQTQALKSVLPEIQVEENVEFFERPDIIVMVIGESSRADHWGIFGYNRQTTPLLEKQSGIFLFRDIVTQSIATRTAVPSLISRRPFLLPDDTMPKNVEPSILKAFEKVGYKTYWLSNQSRTGFFENPIAFYATDANYHQYLNTSSYSALGIYDEIAVKKTNEILQNASSKSIIIIHSMGSHFNYSHRYPPEFDNYQPSMNPRKNVPRNGEGAEFEQVKNSYDNSILYTDFILNSLIESIRRKSENAILIYVSDHAEDIGDMACGYSEITRRSSGAFRVPVLIWFGKDYVQKNGKILEKLSAQKHAPHLSTAIPQTLLDLASIQVVGTRSDSLLIPDNRKSRQVFSLTGGWLDFDASERANPCEIVRIP